MPRYVYSVIRFVPDPANGEFVNVGAIAGSEDVDDWDLRAVSNPKRAKQIDTSGVIDKVFGHIAELASSLDQESERSVDESWLRALYQDSQGVVQYSKPATIEAVSASAALEVIFRELVVDPAFRTIGYRTKHSALSALVQAYRASSFGYDAHVNRWSSVRAGEHATKFDFSVTNDRAVQLSQTWSFETPDVEDLMNEVKAWAWTVQTLRRGGGEGRTKAGRRFEVPKQVDIEVVYVPPRDNAGEAGLREATAAFQPLSVKAVPANDAGTVAVRAQELLAAAAE